MVPLTQKSKKCKLTYGDMKQMGGCKGSEQGRMRGRSDRGTKKLLGLDRYAHYLGYGHDFPVFACMYYVYI